LEAAVYTKWRGPTAKELEADGVQVTDDLSTLAPPDVIHGHHHIQTVEAMLHFPRARGLFVCHDASIWHDRPPELPRLLRYVAVDKCVRDRLQRYPFVRERGIELIPNAVDTERYAPRKPLRNPPERALVFSNYLKEGDDLLLLRRECNRRGIALDTAGHGMSTGTSSPESILPDYDIVFAKARCALEAAACGRFVVLYHDGMLGVPLEGATIRECLQWNLGRRLFTERLTAARLRERLARYCPVSARQVCEQVLQTRSLKDAAGRWIELYREIMTLPLPEPAGRELEDYMERMARTVADLETPPSNGAKQSPPPGTIPGRSGWGERWRRWRGRRESEGTRA
jgi:hypothetical protein